MQEPLPMVIGIEGGGTHSVAIAADLAGNVLVRSRGGSLNFHGSDFKEARRNLRRLLHGLKKRSLARRPIARAVVGCSALFNQATATEKRRLCRGILSLPGTRVLSDCQTARFGATLGSPGVVVIAGTGSIVVAGNSRSRWVRFGGWGHILGDEGSAYWIAVESVKAAIASEDRGESGGKLGRAVRRWFGVRRLTGIVPIVYRPTFRKRDLALLAEDLSKRPGAGGPVFRRICQRAGKELAGQTALAIRSAGLKSGAITVYLVGSVINCNPIVQQAFLRKLRTRRRFRVAAPILSSVFGAVAMALVDAGVTLTPALVARLEKADRQN